jgi:hypothetical protein
MELRKACNSKIGRPEIMPYTYDIIGLMGAALIIVAYLLLQMNKLKAAGVWYSSMNAVGALLIIVSLVAEWNLAAFIIEAFWLAISLFGLIRYFLPGERKAV